MNTHQSAYPSEPRWALLLHPLFWLSVAMLALNDHVLKAQFPGVVTGKLSDVAGVVMIGIVATVVIDRPVLAMVGTASLFALIKTDPLVNAVFTPIFGGPTLIDPTDVAAVVVLVPVGYWLTRRRAATARQWSMRWDGVGAAFRRAVAVLGLGAAVLATTATSGEALEHVSALAVGDDGALYVRTVEYGTDDYRLDVADGGRSPVRWVALDPDLDDSPATFDVDALDWQGKQPRACADDGTCVETQFGTTFTVTEISPDGSEREVYALDADDTADVRTALSDRSGAMEAVPTVVTNGEVIVVSLLDRGVDVRLANGDWHRSNIAGRVDTGGMIWVLAWLTIFVTFVFTIVGSVLLGVRFDGAARVLLMVLVGVVALIVQLVGVFIVGFLGDQDEDLHPAALVFVVVVLAAFVGVFFMLYSIGSKKNRRPGPSNQGWEPPYPPDLPPTPSGYGESGSASS